MNEVGEVLPNMFFNIDCSEKLFGKGVAKIIALDPGVYQFHRPLMFMNSDWRELQGGSIERLIITIIDRAGDAKYEILLTDIEVKGHQPVVCLNAGIEPGSEIAQESLTLRAGAVDVIWR
jgi:hypothetical protein